MARVSLIPLASVLAAAIGIGFQGTTLALRSRMRKVTLLPDSTKPVFGALITWVLGMAALAFTGRLGVFGTGYGDLSHALQEGMIWKVAGLLLVAKWAATVACYGSGGCGGIFSPCLFFGAMSGTMLTGLFGPVLALTDSDRVLVAAGGMSACRGGGASSGDRDSYHFRNDPPIFAGARLDARRVVEPGGGPPARQEEAFTRPHYCRMVIVWSTLFRRET